MTYLSTLLDKPGVSTLSGKSPVKIFAKLAYIYCILQVFHTVVEFQIKFPGFLVLGVDSDE